MMTIKFTYIAHILAHLRRAQSAFRNTGKAQNVESFRPWWIVTKSRAWLMQEKLNLSSWHVDMLTW